MKGLLDETLVADTPAVRQWLTHADAARRTVQQNYADLKGASLISACVQENVLTQLENLRTHPAVAARLARGQLNLHGWVYKIETGQVFAYDPTLEQFAAFTHASIPAPSAPKRRLTVSI